MAASTKSKTALEKEIEGELNSVKPSKPSEPDKTGKASGAIPKKRKKARGMVIALLFMFLIIVALAVIIGLNAFNIRDKYLGGLLRSIPIVKNLMPPEKNPNLSLYEKMTPEEIEQAIARYESELEKALIENENQAKKIELYMAEIDRLKQIEEQQLEFKADKEEFDSLIGHNDPLAFQQFYESVYPENAEVIYREVVGINISQKDLKNYVTAYSSMEASSAAAIFDVMAATELDLVSYILKNMSADARGEILAAMKPTNAAAVTKRMAPEG